MSNEKEGARAQPAVPPGRNRPSLLRRLAGKLSGSFLLAEGGRQYELNCREWNLALTRWQKLQTGLYIVLKDYAEGLFPPRLPAEAEAHESEIRYLAAISADQERTLYDAMRKPFWGAEAFSASSSGFARLWRELQNLGLNPGSRLLELGCGVGWMSEFLAMAGYGVVGTSIAPSEIEIAGKRVAACRARGLGGELRFIACPMETVDEGVKALGLFDGIFVYEALHHAFDWRKTIQAASRCLKPGGWFLIANEPNRLHTLIAYRVARISRTHEIGMSRKELVGEMKRCGFGKVRVLAPRLNNRVSPHWIAGQKQVESG